MRYIFTLLYRRVLWWEDHNLWFCCCRYRNQYMRCFFATVRDTIYPNARTKCRGRDRSCREGLLNEMGRSGDNRGRRLHQ